MTKYPKRGGSCEYTMDCIWGTDGWCDRPSGRRCVLADMEKEEKESGGMKVTIDGREYRADTAIALIEQIKELNWAANPDTSAEGYIAIQADTMKQMWNRKMNLPKGDTEARAIAMFEAIHAMGAWKFERED